MAPDRPLVGIALMLGFCILAPLGDSIAKILGDRVALGHLVLTRFALQAAFLMPLVWVSGRSLRLSGRVLRLAWLRTLLHIAGIACMFTALQYLPIADAIAIAFVMPFIMLILGHFVLGEEVGPRRILACGVGFIGTLMVVQPSFLDVGWVAFLPMAVAVIFAFFMLTTRQIAREVDPVALQALSGLMASALLLPLLALGTLAAVPALEMRATDASTTALLVALGVLGTLAHLLMTWSLRFAPSATLAPMQYLEIPFATIIGFWIFGDLPDGLAAMGIAVTIAAGVYIILREQATARHLARNVPPPV